MGEEEERETETGTEECPMEEDEPVTKKSRDPDFTVRERVAVCVNPVRKLFYDFAKGMHAFVGKIQN